MSRYLIHYGVKFIRQPSNAGTIQLRVAPQTMATACYSSLPRQARAVKPKQLIPSMLCTIHCHWHRTISVLSALKPSQCSSAVNFSSNLASDEVTYEDVVALLNSDDIQLIDVREPSEIRELGYIPKSVNIPLGDIKPALKMTDEDFKQKYHVQKPRSYDGNIVFYGLGPIKSLAALEIAKKYGFKKARHYKGGFEEWAKKEKL